MMAIRVAALYDIHANLPALEAVLDEVRRADVDLVLVGGDVLPGPMPRETLALLDAVDIPIQFIVGNGDREVLAQMRGIETDWYRHAQESWRIPVRWTAGQLERHAAQRLAAWPATHRVHIHDLGDVLFCHATPRNDVDCFTRLTPEAVLVPLFTGLNAHMVVCGHTHMQFHRLVDGVRVVNAGSVGMPFGSPGAYWLLLGPGVEFRRTDYSLESAAACIRATAYPQANDFADNNVLHPPSEEAMAAAFTEGGLK
jgi:predicted phosphodiesterase